MPLVRVKLGGRDGFVRKFSVANRRVTQFRKLVQSLKLEFATRFQVGGLEAAKQFADGFISKRMRPLCKPLHKLSKSNITMGGRRRGAQLKRNRSHQRKIAQMPRSRELGSKPCVSEMRLYENYLRMRQKGDYGATVVEPKTEAELERYVLQTGHFCSNIRRSDTCAKQFSHSVSGTKSGFVVLCSCLLLALLPKFVVYQTVVRAVTGRFGTVGFNPDHVRLSLPELRAMLERAERAFENTHGQTMWSDWPYITLTQPGRSKIHQVAKFVWLLKTRGHTWWSSLSTEVQQISGGRSPGSACDRFSLSDLAWRFLVAEASLPGVGEFVGYQALVSFAREQSRLGLFLYDDGVHAVPGNGCLGALRRWFPGSCFPASDKRAQVDALSAIVSYMQGKSRQIFGRQHRYWDLQAAEHTACEYLKFVESLLHYAHLFGILLKRFRGPGEGKPLRRKRRRKVI